MTVCRLCALVVFFALTGCGGGNSGEPHTPSPETAPHLEIRGPDSPQQGQSVALIALAEGEFSAISWRQTAGPQVSMLTAQSQVLAFDVPAAGDYRFEVALFTTSGQQLSQDYAFSAVQTPSPQANLRLDHVAAQGAKVSLRVDYGGPLQITNITWQRLAGPAVDVSHNQDTQTPQLLFYQAPRVTRDTLMQWRATLTLEDGTQLSDDAFVLVKNVQINEEGYFPKYAGRIVTPQVHPYRPDGPYATVLKDCVYNNRQAATCSFGRLPLLGQRHPAPSIDDVLDRLLVSHTWMGDNFKAFLEKSQAAEDVLTLLGATTAIVIAYDISPSFYWTATGAIYLDAANLWLTPEQRDVLNDHPDYRTDFGRDLAFNMPWRYVKNQQSYLVSYPASLRQERDFADMEAQLAWLLYHELAHANDYFAWHHWDGLRDEDNPLAFSNDHAPTSASISLHYPLLSEPMRLLAQVSFAGAVANAEQRGYLPDDIEQFFAPDLATDYYSYSSPREDFAMLYQHFMMAYRLGALADVAILASRDNPQSLVSWGQRNRVNSSALQARVKAVVESIHPTLDVSAIQRQLPGPQWMQRNLSWWDNIILDDEPSGAVASVTQTKVKEPANGPSHMH